MANSLGALQANGGKVRWRCETGHGGVVDLLAMIAERGEDYDLADTFPPCPECPGVVTFTDGNSMWPRDLTRMKINSPEWWAHTQERRRALEAVGWRVRMGKWQSPEQLLQDCHHKADRTDDPGDGEGEVAAEHGT